MRRRRRVWPIVLLIVCIIVAVLLAAAWFLFRKYVGSAEYLRDKDVQLHLEEADEDSGLEGDLGIDLSHVSKASAQGTYNLLLIGSDRRDSSWYGNSDAMILATINHNVKKVFLTSFMRDLYADIPQVGVRKLNNAFAVGGGPLLVQTLESNYGVSIDGYAIVSFDNMANIIDSFGGLDLDVSEEEVTYVNGYLDELCSLQNLNAADYYVSGSGMMHLNGLQSVAYSRIRYVGNSDFERTSRQREVLMALLSRVNVKNVQDVTTLVEQLLPFVTHNLSQLEILRLIPQVPSVIRYEFVQIRVPFDGMYTINNEILVPDMESTVQQLQAQIYAK